MDIFHKKTSTAPDPSNPGLVGGTDWNDTHVVKGFPNPIDTPPESPDAFNCEFTEGTLPAGWVDSKQTGISSRLADGAYTVYQTVPGSYTIGRFNGLMIPIPDTPGEYFACMERAGGDSSYVGFAMGFANTASGRNLLTAITYHPSYGGADVMYSMRAANILTSLSVLEESPHALAWPSSRLYAKLTVTATSVKLALSVNGRVFFQAYENAKSSYLLSVDTLLLGMHSYTTSTLNASGITIHWVRKGDEDSIHG